MMWNTLKRRDFAVFTFSQTISQFGDKLDYIALIGIIGLFSASRTPLLLSQLMISITLPILLFGPIAGVLVDRWHKKKVLVVCDALRMVCALLIPALFAVTRNMYPVFAVVFIMFLLTLFFNAARGAIIPNLIAKKEILSANSVLNFVGRGATFLGMLAGGLIVDWPLWYRIIGMPGWAVAFILDAVTFGTSAVMLYLMQVMLPEPPQPEEHLRAQSFLRLLGAGLTRVWNELRHAVQMIFRERNLAFAMSTILLMVIAGTVIYVLVIPTVQQDMAWGTRGVGALAAIGAIGLLGGAYLIGVFGHHFLLKNIILMSFVVIGGALFSFPYLSHFWQFGIVVFVAGVAASPVFIGQDTLIHRYADEFIRGRMFSLRDWLLSCLMASGALFVGFIAALTAKHYVFTIFSLALIVLAVSGWFAFARGQGAPVSSHNA
jgi:DHA3 family macrolide efflux protein-like MFS transporter